MAASPYCGARGRLDISAVAGLGPRFVVQKKSDGMLVRLHLDSHGRIAAATSRAGRDVPMTLLGELIGARCGWPGADLVGELMASSEAGVRKRATDGHASCVLFDCVHTGSRPIHMEPYRTRLDALWRMQSETAQEAPALPWSPVQGKRARRRVDGRYTAAVPTDYRLTPIVSSLPVTRAAELWDQVQAGVLEGIVVCALDARAGARNGKRKVRPWDTIDCTVIAVGPRQVTVTWGGQVFALGRGRHELAPGDVVECKHAGHYERGACPKFATIVRRRTDIGGRF